MKLLANAHAKSLSRKAYVWIFFAVLSSLFFTQCNQKNKLPKGDTDNGGLFLPGNFEAVVVVDSLKGRARHIAVNDNGDIYVKLRFPDSLGGNAALRDNDGDGKADEIKTFGNYEDKGSYGTAMRIHNNYLYFSSELNVFRYKLTGDLVPDSKIEWIVADDHPHGRHEHITKPLAFDDKGHMFVPFGAPSNAGQVQNRVPFSPGVKPSPLLIDHGGIWEFDENKLHQTQKDAHKFATGLRSIVAIEWNKKDNNLFVLQHGRDDLLRLWPNKFSAWQSAILPAEEFLKVKDGDNAGWPYYYYDQIQHKKLLNPEYGGDGKIEADGKKYLQPLIGFPAHWAPNDLFFYTGDQFPEHYKNGAFIAFHGSTNRAPYSQSGYFIAFVPFKDGVPSGEYEVFADGFARLDPIVNVSDAVYRPMGIAMGPDGSLYISDTEKGKIWRIMYKGDKAKFGQAQLAQMEKRKSLPHIRTPDIIKDNLDNGKEVGGQQIYTLYCGACHQKNGKGDGSRFPPLEESEWVNGDKNVLINVLLNGLAVPIQVKGKPYNDAMPAHSFLKDEQIAEILTYVRQNFNNKSSAIQTEEVAKMRALLSRK